jgi:hypothetical protein
MGVNENLDRIGKASVGRVDAGEEGANSNLG